MTVPKAVTKALKKKLLPDNPIVAVDSTNLPNLEPIPEEVPAEGEYIPGEEHVEDMDAIPDSDDEEPPPPDFEPTTQQSEISK